VKEVGDLALFSKMKSLGLCVFFKRDKLGWWC